MVSAACHQARMENVTKKPKYYASRETQGNARSITSNTLAWYSRMALQNEQMDTPIGKANALLRSTHRSVVTRWELSNTV